MIYVECEGIAVYCMLMCKDADGRMLKLKYAVKKKHLQRS